MESIQKQKAYGRQLLLERIMDENDKTAQLLSQRQVGVAGRWRWRGGGEEEAA